MLAAISRVDRLLQMFQKFWTSKKSPIENTGHPRINPVLGSGGVGGPFLLYVCLLHFGLVFVRIHSEKTRKPYVVMTFGFLDVSLTIRENIESFSKMLSVAAFTKASRCDNTVPFHSYSFFSEAAPLRTHRPICSLDGCVHEKVLVHLHKCCLPQRSQSFFVRPVRSYRASCACPMSTYGTTSIA